MVGGFLSAFILCLGIAEIYIKNLFSLYVNKKKSLFFVC